MNTQNWRPLTANETACAHKIFANSINYSHVKIYNGIPLLPTLNVAVTPSNSIFFPRGDCPPDFSLAQSSYLIWLIHELTHIWQFQHGFQTWFGGILLSLHGGYRKRSAYIYPPLHTISHFSDLNMEQQADLLCHYFAAAHISGSRFQPQLKQLSAAAQMFINNPHDQSLLPRYRSKWYWFD